MQPTSTAAAPRRTSLDEFIRANTAYPEAAQALGSQAFASGIVAPCFDKALMGLFAGRQIGDPRTYTEMRAWIKGRTLAMLAAPVVFEG